jgi:hypothetical protein
MVVAVGRAGGRSDGERPELGFGLAPQRKGEERRPYGATVVVGILAGREEDEVVAIDWSLPSSIPSTGRSRRRRRSRWRSRRGAGVAGATTTSGGRPVRVWSRAHRERKGGTRVREDKGEGRRRGGLIPAQGRRVAARIAARMDGRSRGTQQRACLPKKTKGDF